MEHEDVRVEDIMVKEVITTSRNTQAKDAWKLMERNRIRHLPIVAGDKLVGMISQRELYLYLTTFAIYSEGQTERKKKPEDLVKIRIDSIMSRDPYTIGLRNTLEEAARTMSHHRLSALPVVEEDKRLVGIVTTQDILMHISHEFHPENLD